MIDQLPLSIKIKIIPFLEPESMKQLSRVNKGWHRILGDELKERRVKSCDRAYLNLSLDRSLERIKPNHYAPQQDRDVQQQNRIGIIQQGNSNTKKSIRITDMGVFDDAKKEISKSNIWDWENLKKRQSI